MYLERTDSIPRYASSDAPSSCNELAHRVELHKDELARYIYSLFTIDMQPHDQDFLMEEVAGFSPVRLAARYLHLQESAPDGTTHREINSIFAQMVETDTLAYAQEFLYRRPILQTEYAIREVEGSLAVVSPSYDAYSPLHAHVSVKERDGAVFQGVKNLESAILNARPDGTIISVSPGGWNGISQLGLPEDQIHIIHTSHDRIIDTTVRATLKLSDCVSFIETISQEKRKENDNEINTIKALTETVVSLPCHIPTHEILDVLAQTTGSNTAWNRVKFDRKNNTYVLDKSFSFRQLHDLLTQDSFLEMNRDVEMQVAQLCSYLKNNADTDDNSLKEMVRNIGKTALTISESIGFELGEIQQKTIHNGDYSKAVAYASEGAGCDTSNSISSFALSEQYSREGVFGHCTQCHSYSSVICGWCMKCVEKSRSQTTESNSDEVIEEPQYGSFLAVIVGGFFTALTKH